MGLIKRNGLYGEYWTSDTESSSYLSQEQMEVNATYIYKYLTNKGWTINSISATLGNMQQESTLNPGCWQSHSVGFGPGYGLVQWTPYINYTSWVDMQVDGDWNNLDNQLARIMYELDNGLQYIPTTEYRETFEEFTKSTKSIEYLTTAFLKNYERAGAEHLDRRVLYSNNWYSYLKGNDPDVPDEPDTPGDSTKRRKGYNFLLFNRKRRIYG